LPVLCEYRAGIRISRRHRQNLARLQAALAVLRLWPTDEQSTAEFAELFRELPLAGRMLAQFEFHGRQLARRPPASVVPPGLQPGYGSLTQR
jgi:predicted nucleic acid-binding protein